MGFHMRHDYTLEDLPFRIRLISKIGNSLKTFAKKNNVAIIVTNQLTTKFNHKGTYNLNPSLGLAWSKYCSTRLKFSFLANYHRIELCYSSRKIFGKKLSLFFQIKNIGFRNVN